jgi:hypothetical protein
MMKSFIICVLRQLIKSRNILYIYVCVYIYICVCMCEGVSKIFWTGLLERELGAVVSLFCESV